MIGNSTLIIFRCSPSLSQQLINVPQDLIYSLSSPTRSACCTIGGNRRNNIFIINKASNANRIKTLVNKLIYCLVIIQANTAIQNAINRTSYCLELLAIHKRDLHALRPCKYLIYILIYICLHQRNNVGCTTNKRTIICTRGSIIDVHCRGEINPSASSLCNNITRPCYRGQRLTYLRIPLLKLTLQESHTSRNTSGIHSTNTRAQRRISKHPYVIIGAKRYTTIRTYNIRHLFIHLQINPLHVF